MEHVGYTEIQDWTPEKDGAFALVCWVQGKWLRVVAVNDDIVSLAQRQMTKQEVPSETYGPCNRIGRKLARLQCRALISATDSIDRQATEDRHRN